MNTDQASRGYLLKRPLPGGRLRLFCFHHAGAGASVFKSWPQALAPADVLPVQLPGREGRIGEARFKDLQPLVAELIEQLGPELRPPFAFYGHSMGALISFAIALALEEAGEPGPEFLAVGAAAHPGREKFLAELLPLSDEELAKVLVRIGGMSEFLLGYPEWRDAANALLRDDLRLYHSYRHVGDATVGCPVHAFAGREDPFLGVDAMGGWSKFTRGEFRLSEVSGGHIFVKEPADELLGLLRPVVSAHVR